MGGTPPVSSPILTREQLGALTDIARRGRRITGREAPFPAILFGRETVFRHQVPSQQLELFAIFQADDEILGTRLPDRNCAAPFFKDRLLLRLGMADRRHLD